MVWWLRSLCALWRVDVELWRVGECARSLRTVGVHRSLSWRGGRVTLCRAVGARRKSFINEIRSVYIARAGMNRIESEFLPFREPHVPGPGPGAWGWGPSGVGPRANIIPCASNVRRDKSRPSKDHPGAPGARSLKLTFQPLSHKHLVRRVDHPRPPAQHVSAEHNGRPCASTEPIE